MRDEAVDLLPLLIRPRGPGSSGSVPELGHPRGTGDTVRLAHARSEAPAENAEARLRQDHRRVLGRGRQEHCAVRRLPGQQQLCDIEGR